MPKRTLAVISLAVFSSMLGVGIIAPILPDYAKSFDVANVWVGLIFSGFSFARALMMPIWGRISDHKGRKNFIIGGLVVVTISALGYPWASSIYALLGVRLLHGMASAAVLPISQAYVGDMATKGEEGKLMGYFSAAYFTGFGAGPLLGGILTDQFNTTTAFYTMAALNLLSLLLVLVLLPEAQRLKTKDRSIRSFGEIISSNIVRGLISFRMTYALARGAFNSFLPIFAGTYLGLSRTQIGLLLGTNALVMSISQIRSGRLADRFNKRRLVIIGSLITPVLYMVFIPLMHNFWQLLALCVVAGLGGAVCLPSALALGTQEGRKFGMGSTMATITMSMSIGFALGPTLGGWIADVVDKVDSVFYFGSIMGLIGMGLFAWFTRRYDSHETPK
ncbi:MFS transporter [Chloroflexota bacterium]